MARDWPFYVAGGFGISLGLGLIATPGLLTQNLGPLATAPLWVGLTFSLTGQALLFAGIMAVAMPRVRRRWRASRVGLCLSCGYDLRGTPHRCPECGQVTAQAP